MDGAHQVKRELQAVSDLTLALVQRSLIGWLSAAVLSRQYCSSAAGQQRLVMLTASAVNAAGLGMWSLKILDGSCLGTLPAGSFWSRRWELQALGRLLLRHGTAHGPVDCRSHNQQACNCSVSF